MKSNYIPKVFDFDVTRTCILPSVLGCHTNEATKSGTVTCDRTKQIKHVIQIKVPTK